MKNLKYIILLTCFLFMGKVFSQNHSHEIKILSSQLKFKSSKSIELEEESIKVLDTLATILKTTDYTYVINSHSDMRGKQEDNLIKTEKRAAVIKTAFVERGIEASRLVVRGYGETSPITTMPHTRRRSANERIEIKKKE